MLKDVIRRNDVKRAIGKWNAFAHSNAGIDLDPFGSAECDGFCGHMI